jgi:hypothetical protein
VITVEGMRLAGENCIEGIGEETSRIETCWKTEEGNNKTDLKEEG